MMAWVNRSKRLDIVLFDTDGTAIVRWQVSGAYPVKFSGELTLADAIDIAVESLKLAYVQIVPP